jgi:hypothetical protein
MADAPDIFISYRRGDAASAARLHRNNIRDYFGAEVSVFLDVRSIEPGEAFADDIRESLHASKLMLAVAGRSYAAELRRREHEIDWVREELLEAKRSSIPIWLVLVDGQQPFDPEELPEPVQWLAETNAITIPTDTSDDGDRLLRKIETFLSKRRTTLSFSDSAWEVLVEQLQAGTCVPIVGTELGPLDYSGPQPMALQRESGDEAKFALFGGRDLPRVAQVLATEHNARHPRRKVRDWVRERAHSPSQPDHPYGLLAGLGLSMYVTTSYEDGLATYIETAGDREPQRIRYSAKPAAIKADLSEPTPETPVVLQLMGDYNDLDSLVVTEDDFFQLLVKMVTDEHFFPLECLDQLTRSSLLFVGFELADWRFRVLLRGLAQNLQPSSEVFAVVTAPSEGERVDDTLASEFAEVYLTRDMPSEVAQLDAHVHYGGIDQFTRELRARLDASPA